MGDLILYLICAAIGYVIGSKIRDKKERLRWTGKVQTVALVCLILLMGMRMGSNEEISSNLSTIGITALVITVVVLVLSVGGIFLARKIMGIDRYGELAGAGTGIEVSEKVVENVVSEQNSDSDPEKKQGMNTMTLIILFAVAAGMAAGYFLIRPAFAENMEDFDSLASLGIKIGLCVLLAFVGLDLGLEGTVIENFKKVGLRILVFPFVVAIASLVGAGFSGILLGFSAKEALAIGAGFGWYSLAPGIIMDAGYLTASAVSFLHNVMREFFSILLIPLVATKIGFVETTAMPGAAAMDVCLPIVEKSTRSEIAVYSFISGVVLSALVPVLVPLIIA